MRKQPLQFIARKDQAGEKFGRSETKGKHGQYSIQVSFISRDI